MGSFNLADVGSTEPGDRPVRGSTTPGTSLNARLRIAQPRKARKGLSVNFSGDGAEP